MLSKSHRLSLVEVNKSKYKNIFYAQEFVTPIGHVIAIADITYLYALNFINDSIPKSIEKILKTYSAKLVFEDNGILSQTKNQLDKYFKNGLKNFTIPLKLTGTDFQKQVWSELIKIPYGKTLSYKQEAVNIGNEKAFRAVANANGKNSISIIIPCHRVVNSNGKLGGYTGGIEKKVYLLELEKLNYEKINSVKLQNSFPM
ncbi:methylated-DNA--[protein]-cysteine S-methyltransferase [Francisellaceae bacterium CB52]|jgi:methylated-DNA-[protein]-cysteine S-methyltransferase